VWVDETRPLLQGARLTAWELAQDGIPHTLIADVAAGQLFARGLVDAVVFGADRIAHNGDAANKIGSYTLSVLAVAHGVPCYVVAPSSTIDPTKVQWRIQDPNQKTPIVHQFSIGPEVRLTENTVASAEYVGNVTRNGRP
jgi:methylthioribose-1-phosphate isomerase